MPEPTVTTIGVISARFIAPLVSDIYKGAKGRIQKELEKWGGDSGIDSIVKILSKIETVKTLWSPDKEVLLKDFYYPSKINDDGVYRKIHSIDDLPEGNLTVQGIVG